MQRCDESDLVSAFILGSLVGFSKVARLDPMHRTNVPYQSGRVFRYSADIMEITGR